jgi:hypothetical protein
MAIIVAIILLDFLTDGFEWIHFSAGRRAYRVSMRWAEHASITTEQATLIRVDLRVFFMKADPSRPNPEIADKILTVERIFSPDCRGIFGEPS